MKKMSIRKDDTVIVLSGKDKGKQGKVLEVMPKDGKVVVDGQALDEDYTTGMSWPLSVQAPAAQVSYPYTVPDDCVWVMGDNRENSADSRYFGPVDRSDLIAVALVRYWPLNRIGTID